MNIVGQIKVDMKPVKQIMARLGVTADGDVQRFHTANVLRRIKRYMPYRSGFAIGQMIINSPVDEPFIHVTVPYAHFQYIGKVWVDPKTGSPWARKYVMKVKTSRNLEHDTNKNPEAGPFWDRRLMAAEGAQMVEELQEYVRRRGRR